jgi:LPS O-antigen subunit length determinant protein (WzzB/FepE family)
MDTHSFLLKLHLEREAFLRHAVAQLQQRICEETDDKAKDWLEEYRKELEQSLKREEQELHNLRSYEDDKHD